MAKPDLKPMTSAPSTSAPSSAASAPSSTTSAPSSTTSAPSSTTSASLSTTPTPLSLFDELTGLKQPDEFHVTDILTRLLKLVGHDVCLVKRNHFSLYWVLSRVRDACDDTNDLVAKTNIDPGQSGSWTDFSTEVWDAFERYTKKILWLEPFLLKFADLAERESVVSTSANKLPTDLIFITTWLKNRDDITKIYQEFNGSGHMRNATSTPAQTIQELHRLDDLMLLESITRRLQGITVVKPAGNTLSVIIKTFESIRKMSIDAPDVRDDVFVYAVQFAMAIEIFVSTQDATLAARLQDMSLWKLAEQGVTLVKQRETVDKLKSAWDAFVNGLKLTSTAMLPAPYKELLRLLVQTRRPFYSQSVQLVSGCRTLASEFNKKKSFVMQHPLETAIGDVKKALEAAAQSVYDPRQPTEFETAENAFTTAEESMKNCFKEYKMSSDEFAKNIKDSRSSDATSLETLEDRFKSEKDLPKGSDVALTVTVKRQNAPATQTYSVNSELTLHAILWKEVSRETDAVKRTALRNKGFFHIDGNNSPLDFGSTIGSLPNTGDASGKKKAVTLEVSA
ncbi:hypothetical protein DFH08DRAFT_126286 [Mycena albidolilacea]|uniref:Uncharacterized protein n=1 Tax=Mycena albidolilacea TaxID=1033008 RepID=A0AAD7ET38_9AGAR|nr:hypothetical protein DFH08DRAFT_126286 [Mycena albidolilacea]